MATIQGLPTEILSLILELAAASLTSAEQATQPDSAFFAIALSSQDGGAIPL